MNKKAIMVKFLVTVLLALIIFTPTCIFTSKFFGLSAQAKDNFLDFSTAVKKMAAAPDGEKTSFILIMDEGSSVVKFDKGKKMEFFFEKGSSRGVPFGGSDKSDFLVERIGNDEFNYYYVFQNYPREQCQDKDCLVLCWQEKNFDGFWKKEEYNIPGQGTVTRNYYNREMLCAKIVAEPLEADTKVALFSLSRPKGEPRRVLIQLRKENGVVYVKEASEREWV